MKVEFNGELNKKILDVGDVIKLNSSFYIIQRTKTKGSFYDIANLDGRGYWATDLSWNDVIKTVEDGEHFPQDEYKLTITKK